MLPGKGSVVAGNSGSPQFENGEGSIPFSGHGGAGGWRDPTGANTCCFQIARCDWISFLSVGMRIGLADAAIAPAPNMAATTAVAVIPRSKRLVI